MSRSRPLIGWYVHHHGAGHRTRFASIRAVLDADVVVFSSLAPPTDLAPGTRWVQLEGDSAVETSAEGREIDPATASPDADGRLHWAPLGHHGYSSRMGALAAESTAHRFDAFVVDVSVEVTLLVRLLGVPTVVMTQPGERDDRPHDLAFGMASRIIAPWPSALYEPVSLRPFRSKTRFVGGISRYAGKPAAAQVEDPRGPRSADRGPSVLLVTGAGGSAVPSTDIDAAASATPEARWHALGAVPTEHVSASPWVADPSAVIREADVVVTWAGQNTIADLASTGARAIVVPQPRPFDEQLATAGALDRAGLAVVRTSWPAASDWPALLEEAAALTPDWRAWLTFGAAERAAAEILDVARGAA